MTETGSFSDDPDNWSPSSFGGSSQFINDGSGLSADGGGGDGVPGDSAYLVAKLADKAVSGAVFERKSAAHDLLEAFRQTCFTEEDVASVIAVIDKLVDDPEHTVRMSVMEQLPQIALFCHEEGPYLDFVLPQHILPHIVKLLTDKFTQVRKTSQAGLLLLVERGIIAPSQVEEFVCPVIMEFTTPAAHEDYRTEIAQFMSKLAPLVGKDITIKSYLNRFCHLCHDKLFQVRRVCASSIGEIAAVVGPNLTEKVLLSHFRSLCCDEVWGVRKGCAETFTIVSSCCRPSTRKVLLTEMFVMLLQDLSRWVRVAACQSLGPFITTFLAEDSPPSTPDCSEVEKIFLAGYKPLEFQLQDSDNNDSDEYESRRDEKQEFEKTSSQTSVISQCPLVVSKTESLSLYQQLDKFYKQSLDQNQNKNASSIEPNNSTDFTVVPMDIDDFENEIASLLQLKSSPSGDTDNSLSFEERRKIAYDQNSLSKEASNQESGDVSSDIAQSSTIKNNDADTTSNNAQHNPNVSVSNSGNETVLHIHAEKEKPKEQDSIGKQLSVISGPASSVEGSEFSTSDYNTWQYWRLPVPDIELDFDLVEGSNISNVHVRAKVQLPVSENQTVTCLSELNLNVVKKENSLTGSSLAAVTFETPNAEESKVPSQMELEINMSGSSAACLPPEPEKSLTLDSITSTATVVMVGGKMEKVSHSDVHRSYMNLYSATRDQGFEDGGFESLKLGDNCDDDDSDEQLSSSLFDRSYGDEYAGHHIWASRGSRPRLLVELPKSNPVSQDIVPDILLEFFTSLCQPSKDHQTLDSELLSFCVYNLPAVVLTLGPQNWSLVRDCYEALACNMQWKIRYTLAASLHEIANVLGPELSERDLVPFYNATIKDLDEVRVGVLRNLSSFIKMLGSEAQRKCLETLNRFANTENSRNWRFRLELADQIKQLSEMYGAEEIFKHLCPLSMELLCDRIAEVRKKALSVIPYLVTRLNYSYPDRNGSKSDSGLVRDFLMHLVKSLGHSEAWVRRQAFAALAGQLIEIGAMSPPQFAQDILPHLINLSEDKVPNVRLVVAQTIAMNIIHLDYFTNPSNPHSEILNTTLLKLQDDTDQDVRYYSQLPEDVSLDSISLPLQ